MPIRGALTPPNTFLGEQLVWVFRASIPLDRARSFLPHIYPPGHAARAQGLRTPVPVPAGASSLSGPGSRRCLSPLGARCRRSIHKSIAAGRGVARRAGGAGGGRGWRGARGAPAGRRGRRKRRLGSQWGLGAVTGRDGQIWAGARPVPPTQRGRAGRQRQSRHRGERGRRGGGTGRSRTCPGWEAAPPAARPAVRCPPPARAAVPAARAGVRSRAHPWMRDAGCALRPLPPLSSPGASQGASFLPALHPSLPCPGTPLPAAPARCRRRRARPPLSHDVIPPPPLRAAAPRGPAAGARIPGVPPALRRNVAKSGAAGATRSRTPPTHPKNKKIPLPVRVPLDKKEKELLERVRQMVMDVEPLSCEERLGELRRTARASHQCL